MRETAHANVFISRVNDSRMTSELTANASVDHAFVGHQMGGAINVGDDQAAKLLSVDIFNVERTNLAVTLNQRDNGFLGLRSAEGAIAALPPTNVSSQSVVESAGTRSALLGPKAPRISTAFEGLFSLPSTTLTSTLRNRAS
jgi:hypothetical protein